ncbi:MAG: hypothetical protein K6F50_08050 [Kiritimatiellae bacterium]|nr:hypothetical protein [Kiritimatiellia bacterium]
MARQIVIGWEEWKASREAKRARLRALGLDAPSRRKTGFGSAEARLRKAFAGERSPKFGISPA